MDVTQQHEARAALQAAFEQIKASKQSFGGMPTPSQYFYVLRPDGQPFMPIIPCSIYTGLTLEDVQREAMRARVFHPEDLERLREDARKRFALRFT